jgi:tRNA modification GTPase
VEYHIHGGKAVINGLLTALNNCSVERIRQAEPGEFAKRAFYNGKLDLTSLEGLSDLINSETEAQRKQAFRQMTGDLKNLYDNWRQRVIEALAYTNAVIDFGEEEMDVADTILPAKKITQTLLNDIKNHLYDDKRGVRLREGVHITIMGPPNSGKSSLMNWLTQRSTSIVSNIPGTTRDVIESFVDIGGYPVVFTDTAGLRSTVDLIEQEGIRRALEQARLSDLRIIVLDANNLISLNNVSKFKELFQREALPLKNTDFILLNKTDLIPKETSSLEKTFTGISKAYPHQKVLKISCKDKTNLQQFLNQLIDEIKTKCESSSLVPTQTRHRLHLEKCEFFLQKALGLLHLCKLFEFLERDKLRGKGSRAIF